MAVSIQNILMYVVGGGFVGGLVYLYQNNFFSGIGGGAGGGGTQPCLKKGICVYGYTWSDSQCKCVPSAQGENPEYTGGAVFYMKRKKQCLDNHLTASYLRSQGVKLVGYKLFNDNQIYAAVCGGPGPLTVLAAIEPEDGQSGSILQDLGFVEYQGEPLSNVAYAMVAQQQGPFRTERY